MFIFTAVPKGYVHSFQTGAAADGPGVRFALFLSGCPLRCLYCHNPDTWAMNGGTLMDSREVAAKIGEYAPFLRTAGGLTISGGEPLVQPDFVGDVFKRAKRLYHLHTALDTQGYLAGRLPDEWFKHVDLVLLDIKEINPERYKRLTGVELAPTLEFAKRLERLGIETWLRYVLVPGITDFPEDVLRLADFIRPLKNFTRADVLPFHNMAIHKWDELGIPYSLRDQRSPTREEAAQVQEILSEAIRH